MSVDEGEPPFKHSRLAELAKEASLASGQPVEIMERKGNVYEEIITVADVLNPLFIMIGLTSKISLGKIIGPVSYTHLTLPTKRIV